MSLNGTHNAQIQRADVSCSTARRDRTRLTSRFEDSYSYLYDL